jgi:hypothetical protein
VVVIDENERQAPPQTQGDRDAAAKGPGHAIAEIGATLNEDEGSHKRRWRLFRKGGE